MGEDQAEMIVEAIIRDLGNRHGLSQEWGQIDSVIQSEIRAEWTLLARIVLDAPARKPDL